MSSDTPKMSRRSHNKSKNGCYECKRRRRKCNEARPVCLGCQRRGISDVCKYPSSSPWESERSLSISTSQTYGESLSLDSTVVLTSQIASKRASCSTGSPKSGSNQSRPGNLGRYDLDDICLFHHFTTKTLCTLSTFWTTHILPLAKLNDYLMHGILAVSAIHFAHEHPDQGPKFILMAAEHQNLGIQIFQEEVKHLSQENCAVVFSYSSTLNVYSFAAPNLHEASFDSPGGLPYQGLANWLNFLRGCASIFRSSGEMMESRSLTGLVVRSDTPAMYPEHDLDDRMLVALSNSLFCHPYVMTTTTIKEMEAYTTAIHILRNVFARCMDGEVIPDMRPLILAWPVKISQDFVRLLHEERAPALIIMSWYRILLKKCESCWYIGSRGLSTFSDIEKMLDKEWDNFLAWPKEVFYSDP